MILERSHRKHPEREGEAVFIEKTKSVSLRSKVRLDGFVRPDKKIDRATAERTGESLYWPSEPCKNQHEYWRITATGKCLACRHQRHVSRYAMPNSGGRSWKADELRRLKKATATPEKSQPAPPAKPERPARMPAAIRAAAIDGAIPAGATHFIKDSGAFLKAAKKGAYTWSQEAGRWVYAEDKVARVMLKKAVRIDYANQEPAT